MGSTDNDTETTAENNPKQKTVWVAHFARAQLHLPLHTILDSDVMSTFKKCATYGVAYFEPPVCNKPI